MGGDRGSLPPARQGSPNQNRSGAVRRDRRGRTGGGKRQLSAIPLQGPPRTDPRWGSLLPTASFVGRTLFVTGRASKGGRRPGQVAGCWVARLLVLEVLEAASNLTTTRAARPAGSFEARHRVAR